VAAKRLITLWRVVGKIVTSLIKTILLLLVIAVLTPAVFFLWRAGKPLKRPEFSGLTFYQYMSWRIETHNIMADAYQTAHPDKNIKTWGCNVGDVAYYLPTFPLSGFYTLAGIYPDLRRFVNPKDYEYIPTDATLTTFLPSWWTAYEAAMWNHAQADQGGFVVYCRLPQYPPTPEELVQSR
jgi:hypothetical protein